MTSSFVSIAELVNKHWPKWLDRHVPLVTNVVERGTSIPPIFSIRTWVVMSTKSGTRHLSVNKSTAQRSYVPPLFVEFIPMWYISTCVSFTFPYDKKSYSVRKWLVRSLLNGVITWFIVWPVLPFYASTHSLPNAPEWNNCSYLPFSSSRNTQN